ncbi:MAG: hypothetical protein LM558_00040 [Thermosphaera sp.]|nr:hypothetical protein [Thermosphaera sp.]
MSRGILAGVEIRSMSLGELIRLVRERKARLVNTLGTPVIEIEDPPIKRRIIVSNLVFEKDRVKEKTVDGKEKIYLVSPSRILRPTAHGGDVVKT